MTTHVVLNLGSGSLVQGCPYITAALYTDRERVPERFPPAALPPAPELADQFRQYQVLYGAYYGQQIEGKRALKVETGGLTNFSAREFHQVAQSFQQGLQDWLQAASFQPTYQAICQHLQAHEEIRVILETSDPLLRRLPWQLWDFFEDYPFAELALSLPVYGRLQADSQTRNGRVRILAIFGNGQGLDLQADRKAIASLPGAAVQVLPETEGGHLTREQLNDALWDSQGWDILFFAGHSMTDTQTGTGSLQINTRETLSIEQLRYGLKTAINRGLNLAIFNSCDGLGLAQGLSDLNLPQVIVMREKVPDKVAQKFFTYFLEAYAQGRAPQSLYQSLRQARLRLQGLENDYPYASWLPVLSQNPTTAVKTWQQLRYPLGPRQPQLPRFVGMLMAISLFCLGIRPLGLLQPYELMGYDHFLQGPVIGRMAGTDPGESPIFIVQITEADLNQKVPGKPGSESISDAKLLELLQTLKNNGATTIGSDILRVEQGQAEAPSNEMSEALQDLLQDTQQFFGVCRHGIPNSGQQAAGVPPPGNAKAYPRYQSFSNIQVDPDNVVRRHLVAQDPDANSLCQADFAFSTNLALDYIQRQHAPSSIAQAERKGRARRHTQIGLQPPVDLLAFQRNLAKHRLGANRNLHPIPRMLTAKYGPYQGTRVKDGFGGVQLLLHYRHRPFSPFDFPSDSLGKVLEDPALKAKVEGRIVLIGRTENKDRFSTPFPGDYWNHQPTPGVYMHAHMADQMIQFHQGHSLMDVLPLWGEILWTLGWTLLGGLGLWFTQKQRLRSLLVGLGLLGGLYLSCWGVFLMGLWVPMLSPALALAITSVFIFSRAGVSLRFSSLPWRPQSK